jgi:hypothetical protein
MSANRINNMFNDSESEKIGFNNIMNNSNLVNPDSKTQSNDNSGDDNSLINSNSKESSGS